MVWKGCEGDGVKRGCEGGCDEDEMIQILRDWYDGERVLTEGYNGIRQVLLFVDYVWGTAIFL